MMKYLSIGIFVALVAGASAQCQLPAGDVSTLNYALTLEYLEANYYSVLFNETGFPQLNATAFANAGYAPYVRPYLVMIAQHEATHVTALRNTLSGAGCYVTQPCTYVFGAAYDNVTNFLGLAHALENTGVSAYDGAIAKLTDGTLRQVAATIATIEARHTAYLATLISVSPFPAGAFDLPLNSSQVYAIAGAYVSGACDLNATGPTVQCNYAGVTNSNFQTPNASGACGIFAGDLITLNYALALEYLEAAFYAQGLLNLNVTGNLTTAQSAYLVIIAGHEAAHVTFLNNTIAAFGCAANLTQACTYNFASAFGNTTTFLETAYVLENLGVSAYDGALFTIRDSGFRTAAATIATVEARHAAVIATFLTNVTGNATANATVYPPWPGAFDTAANSTFVLGQASAFITTCPITPVGPAFVAVNLSCADVQSATTQTTPTTQSTPTTQTAPTTLVAATTVVSGGSGISGGGVSTSGAGATTGVQCAFTQTDVNTLNYALTLEYLEQSFYSALNNVAYPQLSQAAFAAAGYPAIVYNYLLLIANHETAHVQYLRNALVNSNCFATSACAYNFTTAYANVSNFIETALALESTGVAAYNGAINTIISGPLRQAAATIGTVEARHTAFIALLANSTGGPNPFPNVVDPASSSSAIYAIAASFLVNASQCFLPATVVQQCNYTGVFNFGLQTPFSTGACGISSGDLVGLNYALALEYLEAAYYRQGLNTAAVTSSLNSSTLAYLNIIASHEAAHVTFLNSTIYAYGCGSNATQACNYNFAAALTNGSQFLSTAADLEDLGVTAYVGAIWNFRDALFRQAGHSIATVEARHAAVVRYLIGGNPFPQDFTTPNNSSFVLSQAGTYITSCPNGPVPVGPAFAPVSLNCTEAQQNGGVSGGGVSQTTVASGIQTTSIQTTAVRTTTTTTGAASIASISMALIAVAAAIALLF